MEGGIFIIFLLHIPHSYLTPSPNPLDTVNLNILLDKGQSSSSPSYKASPPKQAQDYQDYQVGGCSTCSENVESLSSARIASLTESMRNLLASSDWERVTSIHGQPVRSECRYRFCCVHGGGRFLPWHRVYLDSFNSALGTVMPYWDWTTSSFPSIARSGPFSRGLMVFEGRYTTRRSRRIFPGRNLRAVLAALEEDDFLLFSTQFEDIHDDIHLRVGGSMSNLGISSYDPIFFLLHSFIDLVWAVYQILKPDSVPPNSRQVLHPYGRTIGSTLSSNRFNLNINSNRIVFGGMTLSQIQNRISRNTRESTDYSEPKIYAGFFKRNFGTSGIIKFNICKLNKCSYNGGEVAIFGGKSELERPYFNSNPTKVDITDAYKRAGIENIRNLKFKITSFEDLNGRNLNLTVANPIRIVRMGASGNDVWKRYLESGILRLRQRLGARARKRYLRLHLGGGGQKRHLRMALGAGVRKRHLKLGLGAGVRKRHLRLGLGAGVRKRHLRLGLGTGVRKRHLKLGLGAGVRKRYLRRKGIVVVRPVTGAGRKGILQVRPDAGGNGNFTITPDQSGKGIFTIPQGEIGNGTFGIDGKDFYCIIFNRSSTQPPTIRIPKRTLFEIDSPHEVVMTTKSERNYRFCDKKGSYPVPSSKPLNANHGNYYLFDDDCKPQLDESTGTLDYVSKTHIVKE